MNSAYLSKLQQGLNRSTKMCIFSSSPKDRYGMMRSRPCRTLGLERTKVVLIWSSNITNWSLSPVNSKLPCKKIVFTVSLQCISVYDYIFCHNSPD